MMYFALEFKSFKFGFIIAKRMRRLIQKYLPFIKSNFELAFWILALVALYFGNVDAQSLCFFRFLGVGWCPGCGLGHSIHASLHLDFATSFSEHPLGIPALLIIAHRIKQLVSKPTLRYEQQ